MKPDRNPQKRTYLVGSEQYQKNFGLYLIVFVFAGALMILSNTFGWDSSLIFGITVVVSIALILIFRPRRTKVRVELEDHTMRVIELAKNGEEKSIYEAHLESLSSLSCKRSGRYAELLRVNATINNATTSFVFCTEPSPKSDDPMRKLEEALKHYAAQ